MKLMLRILISAMALCALPTLAQQAAGPVSFVGLMELAGTGARPGTNFDNGANVALKELNVADGAVGRKIDYRSFEDPTNPAVAEALAQKAIDTGACGVLGPVHSGSMVASEGEARRADIPSFRAIGDSAREQCEAN
jgi:branched-chain amino acid transport system substrate-binding protein